MEPNEALWYAKGWTACMDAIGLMLDDIQHQVAGAVIQAEQPHPHDPDVAPVTGDEAETEPEVLDMSRTSVLQTVTDDWVSRPNWRV